MLGSALRQGSGARVLVMLQLTALAGFALAAGSSSDPTDPIANDASLNQLSAGHPAGELASPARPTAAESWTYCYDDPHRLARACARLDGYRPAPQTGPGPMPQEVACSFNRFDQPERLRRHRDSGVMRGDDVHILTGAHGFPDSSIVADAGLLADDVARFGGIPGVRVHDLTSMSPARIRGPGPSGNDHRRLL